MADDDKKKDFEIEIEDDDQKKSDDDDDNDEGVAAESDDDHKAEADDDEDEVEKYSKNVQKRIKQLTWKQKQAQREKEEAERVREEAIRFAQQQHGEVNRLRKMLEQGERGMVETANARYKAELESAKAAYRAAYEEGDAEKITEAQARIAEITSAAQRWKEYRPRFNNQQQPQRPQQQQRPQPPKPDDRALEWQEDNPWFQKNHRMTAYALGVHQELVQEQGLDPTTDEYYDTINKEMRKAFPDYFGQKRGQRASEPQGSVVAPASRSQRTPRRVTLTRSQVELAKRLNITPEQYAEQLLKEMKS